MNVCLWHLLYKIIFPTFVIFNLSFVIFLSGCGDLESELESLSIKPSNPTIGINQTQLFTVTAKDTLGFIVYVTPTWSVSTGIGTISSSGLFTAGASTGEGYVTATYGTTTASTEVTVTDKCWIEGRVRGTEDAAGVLNILVSLLGTSLSDLTDTSGNYSISGVSAGTYDVRAEDDRPNPIYQAATQEGITVSSGETRTVSFYLYPRPGLTTTTTITIPTF